MALTLAFGDDFNADHSASYDFASFGHASPLVLSGGHLDLSAGEWLVSPTGISVTDGVAVVKFHFDAAAVAGGAFVDVYFGADSAELNTWGSYAHLVGNGDTSLAVEMHNSAGALVDGGLVTIPSGAFTGWLVGRRVSNALTVELWSTDPGGGGSALGSFTGTGSAGPTAERVLTDWKALDGGYVDYWNVYSGTGTIPQQEAGGGGSSLTARSLLYVGA